MIFRLFSRIEGRLSKITDVNEEDTFISSTILQYILSEIIDVYIAHIYDTEVKR